MALARSMIRQDSGPQSRQPGIRAGFSTLYQEHGRSLYGTALRMLQRPEDAEDAVQEAFLTLYRRAPTVEPLRVGAWLHRVLVNHCIDQLRRSRRWRLSEVTESVSVTRPRQDGASLDLERAVARLPQRARLVLLLHDVEGFTHQETAELLDLSEGTSKSQLSRARRLLREQLSGPGGGP